LRWSEHPSLLPPLYGQALRTLFRSTAFWAMLVLLSLLVGYSFIQAVALFSQASETALAYPALGGALDPVDGVFVPSFGAYYLVETLLLPFVAIRLVGLDCQTGALKLLLQLPVSPTALMATKLAALLTGGLLFLLPAVSTIVIWWWLGGAIHWPALGTLLLGHLLHALTIVCIAMLAAVVSGSIATAAMIALAVTLGSWVLDFAGNSAGWLAPFSALSLTTLLRPFESGLLSSSAVAGFALLSSLAFFAAAIFLHPGRPLRSKWLALVLLLAIVGAAGAVAAGHPLYFDATENRRHSFPAADARALAAMDAPLTITIHMARDDSRLYDFDKSVLSRLRRTVPKLRIVYADPRSTGLFGAPEDDQYGLIEYDYRGRHDESYSTSPLEVLPLIHALAGQQVEADRGNDDYRGHPLVADATPSRWWFYLVLPLTFLLGAGCLRRPRACLFFARKTP